MFRFKFFFLLLFIFTYSCIGNIHTVVEHEKSAKTFPKPISLSENEIWSAPGMRWNGIQYLRFSLNDEEKKMHQSAVYHALNQSRDGEITSWYSDSKKIYGSIRIIQSFPISDGNCRIYQSLIHYNNSMRHFTNNACKRFYAENWLFLK